MVFSSIPVYLDPPNWHQQQNHHLQHQQHQQQVQQQQQHNLLGSDQNPQLPPLPPQPPPLGHGGSTGSGSGSGSGSIRPGSMADRARMAKIPQPEAALKCPRCDSTNTKFCYFNNYSLTQPRHFCKTCRRYWTRGGALRSVPVGGGCRRNKKTKSSSGNNNGSRSKSPAPANSSGDPKGSGSGGAGVISPSGSNGGGGDMIGHFSQNPNHHHSFMASIQNMARFGGGGNGGGIGVGGALGLNFGDIHGVSSGGNGGLGFQIGSGGSGDHQILQGDNHQWRLQQHFPMIGTPDFDSAASSAPSLYPFHHHQQAANSIEAQSENAMVGNGMMTSSSGGPRVSQFPPVKLEGARPGLSNFWAGNNGSGSGNNGGNNNTSWTDLAGLNSSSTSHLL